MTQLAYKNRYKIYDTDNCVSLLDFWFLELREKINTKYRKTNFIPICIFILHIIFYITIFEGIIM